MAFSEVSVIALMNKTNASLFNYLSKSFVTCKKVVCCKPLCGEGVGGLCLCSLFPCSFPSFFFAVISFCYTYWLLCCLSLSGHITEQVSESVVFVRKDYEPNVPLTNSLQRHYVGAQINQLNHVPSNVCKSFCLILLIYG